IPRPARRRASVLVGVSGGVAFEAVGAASPAGGVDVGVAIGRRLSMEAGGRHVLARSSALDPGEVRVSLDAAVLRLCAAVAGVERALEARVCAAGAAGVLRGEGAGYPPSIAASSAWLAAGGGLAGRWRLDARWRLVLGAEALAPVRQGTFSEHNLRLMLLESALAEMDPALCEVFVLFELDELSGQEISDALSVPLGTVYSRLQLARESFRRTVDRVEAGRRAPRKRVGDRA